MYQPQTHEHPEWAKKYINLVEGDVLATLATQAETFTAFILSLASKENFAYAPGKWTIKELIGHCIDTERILVFRLLCFARGEKSALPGFNEDDYVANAHFANINLQELAQEFCALRKANLYLFNSLNVQELDRKGTASEQEISVRALVYVCAGHLIHHSNIINERYL